MVVRKPPRSKTSRKDRLRTAGALRGNGVGEKSSSAAERIRTRRSSTKAVGPEAAQETSEIAAAGADPAATEKGSKPATTGSKPSKRPPRATGGGRAAAEREKHAAPAPEATAAETPPPAAARPPRRAARAAAPAAPETPPATSPSSPRAGKGTRQHAGPRSAAPTTTPLTTPAAAAAGISPELGLGLAQALGAELAGLSQRLLEASTASAQELASVRSVPELIELQNRQLKALTDAWLEHSSRITEIYLAAIRPSERR